MSTPPTAASTPNGPPRQQTAESNPSTKHPHPSGLQKSHTATTTATTMTTSSADNSVKSPSSPSHQRFVLTDHIAFKYLEDDVSTTVLSRREKLEGYETYLVEQWACSRVHPTFIITTYTGDPKDTVWAAVISVPLDETAWSPAMRIYFKALNEYHARRRETRLGTLMTTNLNGFPSSLTIIPIPDGDMRKNRELFLVAENLKRLGCSGRLGIKLAEPSSATQAKFHQLYRTSDKIPLNHSVIELVKLCQAALVIFGKLEPEYADGLLCDVTERAINDWWVEFGAEYYTVEPQDGILGPTTVAALLGMLMGARNRLSAFNAPVAKDVFDIEATTKGISYFQKTQRLSKTRRLDRQTLERLRRATAKAATKESWAGVPRAFKTTVAELGGKGGEMVMGMVGAGDKAGIADIETTDFDRFVELVYGERAKWLWYGKPRKSTTGDMFSRLPGVDEQASPEDHQHMANYVTKDPSREGHSMSRNNATYHNSMDLGKRSETNWTMESIEKERDSHSKRSAIKRATGKIESGSGFHRIKDKVNRRTHQHKPSKDDAYRGVESHTQSEIWSPNNQSTEGLKPSLELGCAITDGDPLFTTNLTGTPQESESVLALDQIPQLQIDDTDESRLTIKPACMETDESRPPTVENSVAGSIYRGIDLNDRLPCDETQTIPPLLRRTYSSDQLSTYYPCHRNDNWYPRHLSFSIAEESVLTWPSIISPMDLSEASTSRTNLQADLATHTLHSESTKRLHHHLSLLQSYDLPWSMNYLSTLASLNKDSTSDIFQLESLYYSALDTYQSLREDAHEVVSSNRVQLGELVRDLANLGDKLDYEIGGLESRVGDLNEGVGELERLVAGVEGRVSELEKVCGGTGKESWVHWGIRMVTGLGRKSDAS